MRGWLVILCGLLTMPGCVVIKTTVRNPVPEMTTIAVAPFFNLTQEPNSVVDGRRFALAYYSELQKTQGFEVIPVGVVESTILQHRLELQDPEDALKLCELLNADAIVVGAITDYDPYYPPRIGLQVDWYSPKSWVLPITSAGLLNGTAEARGWGRRNGRVARNCRKSRIRGQSPDLELPPDGPAVDRLETPPFAIEAGQNIENESTPTPEHPVPPVDAGLGTDYGQRLIPPGSSPLPGEAGTPKDPDPTMLPRSNSSLSLPGPEPEGVMSSPPFVPQPEGVAVAGYDAEFDPTQPLMSYTRHFDGAEAELVNKLRDYLELRGDRRNGSWEEYLHRSEDFIRFVSHLMVVEMLSVHGGSNRSEVVFKWRKYR